jgi:Mn-dependent DtxR family transcriptional regulator
MSRSSRNFYTIDIGRPRTTSGLADDLAEKILLTLGGSHTITQKSLAETLGGDPAEIQELVHTMINLKLIEPSKTKLTLSASGKIALKTKLLSVSGGDGVQ